MGKATKAAERICSGSKYRSAMTCLGVLLLGFSDLALLLLLLWLIVCDCTAATPPPPGLAFPSSGSLELLPREAKSSGISPEVRSISSRPTKLGFAVSLPQMMRMGTNNTKRAARAMAIVSPR